jgi:hypothetical protein
MFVRNPSASLARWGRTSLLLALSGLPLWASCTKSEDTEPFVPAQQGATQPPAEGALISEDDACDRVRKAYEGTYDDLGCDLPEPPQCPAFIRPGAGSGCYEYYEDSVATCEKAYQDAGSCGSLVPCVVSAKRNDALPSCVPPSSSAGGAGGQGAGGQSTNAGADGGGAPPLTEGGAPSVAGAPASTAGAPDMPAGGAGP